MNTVTKQICHSCQGTSDDYTEIHRCTNKAMTQSNSYRHTNFVSKCLESLQHLHLVHNMLLLALKQRLLETLLTQFYSEMPRRVV